MPLDRYGRNIDYLRISLTDVCNLRCIYCMPEDMSFRPGPELMQTEEIRRLINLFAQLGFSKIRFTGGEPTLREDVVDIVRHIRDVEGISQVALTTNAILLNHLAKPLAEAGLHRINVSLDTLDPKQFRTMTRWGNLEDVWKGIRAAEEAGIEIKINAVVVRGFNDGQDVVDLARLTLENAWQVRFIEVMPFGRISEFQQSHTVAESELRKTIGDALGPLVLQDEGKLDGEAKLYRIEGAPGCLGFISSVTQPFCAGCNRARITADGKLRLCLLRDKELDLLSLLREGADDDELLTLIKDSIHYKPWGHGLAENIHPHKRTMSEIGG